MQIGRNPMDLQLDQFANTSAEIKQILGLEAGEKLLSQALYWVNMGSNDFLDNYFAPFSPIGNLSSEQVNALVLGTYEQQLTVTLDYDSSTSPMCSINTTIVVKFTKERKIRASKSIWDLEDFTFSMAPMSSINTTIAANCTKERKFT
jgi:hypothetical protein